MTSSPSPSCFLVRYASLKDLDALMDLEESSFTGDRLSRRRMRHWICAENSLLLVAEYENSISGYCLVLLLRGTRLARLYSIATHVSARGQGLGKTLLCAAEEKASELGWLFMRLEVAQNNTAAIHLYRSVGYQEFDIIENYYEDHQNALRMQKRIRYIRHNILRHHTPWYGQTTDFTCGPASLMMAMASLNADYIPTQSEELKIWREATTIFMTSGHGGCHPVGLALSASNRGFKVKVFINRQGPLFLDGVRNKQKKQILETVENNYYTEAQSADITFQYRDVTQDDIETHLNSGGAVNILISLYRMQGTKTPHWVTITGMDEHCIYLHEPDPDDPSRVKIDCQHIPVARADFDKMASFGSKRLRTALFLKNPD